MARIAIDPVTRIGGHLRIEVEITNGVVSDAWSSGTMFRGIEQILHGRDPRSAWLLAQRVCGACTGVHALASVRAVENALGLTVPRNARLIRNVLAGSQQVQDAIVHFYHQHALDWVDVAAAATADPARTSSLAQSLSSWPQSSTAYFTGIRDRLATLLQSGQPSLFGNAWSGHPAYRLTPEMDLLVMAHYLEALDWLRTFAHLPTLLGGKYPHPQTYVVGGMAVAPPWGGPVGGLAGEHPQVDRNSPAALNAAGLTEIARLLADAKTFVDQVLVPDVLAVAGQYPDWAPIGAGIGNYLSYGEYPEDESSQPTLLIPRGRIIGRDLARVQPVDQAAIAETVAHSWYDPAGSQALKHPWDEQTSPKYAGPKPPFTTLEGSDRYSWIKAPRYQEAAMETGPLARILVAMVEGRADTRAAVNDVAVRLGVGPNVFFGTLGRTLARAIDAQIVAARLDGWHKELVDNLATGDVAVANLDSWDPASWPASAQGWSLGESPRGAVGHWVKIRDRRVDSYQILDATTWNGSPRDGAGHRGALEEALVGTPVADAARPLEVLRTVHSFDPCAACAVHAWGSDATDPVEIRIVRGS